MVEGRRAKIFRCLEVPKHLSRLSRETGFPSSTVGKALNAFEENGLVVKEDRLVTVYLKGSPPGQLGITSLSDTSRRFVREYQLTPDGVTELKLLDCVKKGMSKEELLEYFEDYLYLIAIKAGLIIEVKEIVRKVVEGYHVGAVEVVSAATFSCCGIDLHVEINRMVSCPECSSFYELSSRGDISYLDYDNCPLILDV